MIPSWQKLRTLGARFLLATWLTGMLVLGAALLAKHVVALPAPARNERLLRTIADLRAHAGASDWLAVHVLYSECRCSQRVVAHLVSTARPSQLHEVVLWVGANPPAPELAQHFEVRRITSAQLAGYGIDAAPLLIVSDPKGEPRYVGGYTTRKQGPVLEDLSIVEQARRGSSLASLPIFGCAVSERLQRELTIVPGL